jgi:predicted small secreted protein
MKKWMAWGCVLVMLAGCNTMKGLGQDIQKAGETIEDAAKRK